MKILVVDDSATMRKVVILALKSGGYEYIEAESGEDALKKIENDNFDFFLVDVNMPGINGIELTKKLRAITEYSNTPIVILTTEKEDDIKQEGLNAGANAWIVKPFQKEELLKIIKENS